MLICAVCHGDSETLEYVILRCTARRPVLPKGVKDLTPELGFAGEDGRTKN